MLDGLLGRGFTAKCKSLIKLTKSRIDVLRRKRNATIKFLKKDLAELLSDELDVNAHGRAAGLLDELRLLWNLEFVEKSCNTVLKHLPIMQKQRECPEDCREAVSSLMFAASAFSELLELRDLRHIFHERYGNSLELLVNQEFVESLSSKSFSHEKKIKLMKDIAQEFSIQWNSDDFEQRMCSHNATVQDRRKNYGSSRSQSEKYISVTGNGIARGDEFSHTEKGRNARHEFLPPIGRAKSANEGIIKHHSREGNKVEQSDLSWSKPSGPSGRGQEKHRETNYGHVSSDKCGTVSGNETVAKGDRTQLPSTCMVANDNKGGKSYGKVSERNGSIYGREDTSARKGNQYSFQGNQRGSEEHFEQRQVEEFSSGAVWSNNSRKGMAKVQDGSKHHDDENGRENLVPTLESSESYFGSNGKANVKLQLKHRMNESFGANERYHEMYGSDISAGKAREMDKHRPKYFNNALPPPYVKPSTKQNDTKMGLEYSRSDKVRDDDVVSSNITSRDTPERAEKVSCHSIHEKRHGNNGRHNEESSPKKSSRRKVKSPDRDDISSTEDFHRERRVSRSRRKERSGRGLKVLLQDEQNLDDEEERVIDKLLMHYSRKPSSYEDIKIKNKSKSRRRPRNVELDDNEAGHESRDLPDRTRMSSPPARSISLPNEEKPPAKVFSRAASFEPDRSSARHVHPKLPDYDDLAARFAALKGR